MFSGWIKLHRSLLDWEWYDDVNVKCLYLHCLMRANHKPKKYRGTMIETGQFTTSQEVLAKELHLSIMQIRTAINKLKSTGEITVKANNKFSMISITNWDSYQDDNRPGNKRTTNEQQASNRPVTTNKNVRRKEGKNKDKEGAKAQPKKRATFKPPTLDEIKAQFVEKQYQVPFDECEKFFLYYESNGWMVGRNKMKKWQSAFSGWIKRSKEYAKSNGKVSDREHRQGIGDFIEEQARGAVERLSEGSVSKNEDNLS